jgi:caa(3)-type oxidase subunit IV
VSLAAAYLPFPQVATVTVIFLVAVVKTLLVAANFMHLRFEKRLIRVIPLVPVLLFLILVLALLPDIAFKH